MDAQQLLEVFLSALFGLMFGSFSTMASYRLPRGEDMIFKPSRCPCCEHRLGVPDLFPVLSWFLSKGRCRHCKTPVSGRYPLIELVTGLLFVLVYLKAGISLQTLALWGLSVCLVIMVVVDMERSSMPSLTQWAMVPCGFLYVYTLNRHIPDICAGVILGVLVAIVLRGLCRGSKAGGWFDREVVKFFGIAGLFLGVDMFLLFVLTAMVVGGIVFFVYGNFGQRQFSLGLPLAVALFSCLMIPQFTAAYFLF